MDCFVLWNDAHLKRRLSLLNLGTQRPAMPYSTNVVIYSRAYHPHISLASPLSKAVSTQPVV